MRCANALLKCVSFGVS